MLQILLIVLSLSIDCLVTSFAYGTQKIKFSAVSCLVITFFSTSILVLSTWIGDLLQQLFPTYNLLFICALLLGTMGVIKLIQFLLKYYLFNQPNETRYFKLKCSDVSCKIELSLSSDLIHSTLKLLSIKEAILLSFLLSLDSIAVGISIGLTDINPLNIFLFFIVSSLTMTSLGNFIGYKLSKKFDVDLSWFSGLVLIILAILKLT